MLNLSGYSTTRLKVIADQYNKLNVVQQSYVDVMKGWNSCSQFITYHTTLIAQFQGAGWTNAEAQAFATMRFAIHWDNLPVSIFGNPLKLTCPGNASFINYFKQYGLDLKNPLSFVAELGTSIANTAVIAAKGTEKLTETTFETANDIVKKGGEAVSSGLTFAKALPYILVIGGGLLIWFLISSGTVKQAISAAGKTI